jgi:hypothetical protein
MNDQDPPSDAALLNHIFRFFAGWRTFTPIATAFCGIREQNFALSWLFNPPPSTFRGSAHYEFEFGHIGAIPAILTCDPNAST